MNVTVLLTKVALPKLATKVNLSILDVFEKKVSRWGVVKLERGFTLSISNGEMNYIIRVVTSLESLGLLIDGATGTVKHEIKREVWALLTVMTLMFASLNDTYDFFIIQTVASSLIKRTLGIGVRERQEGGILPLLAAPL